MDAPFALPPRLDVACLPTRIRPLDRLSAQWGGPRLWIKHDDDTGGLLSGNKIRKLQYAVRQALDQGADTLVTCGGIQSNHCRATAALARQLGLRVLLVLRGEPPGVATGNLLLDQVLGAQIHWVTAEQYRDNQAVMESLAEQERRAGHRPFVVAEGCSMPPGCWGYIEAAIEIAEAERALGVRFDAIVHAVGSGGTSAGLELGRRLLRLHAMIYGVNVCDDAAYFRDRIAALAVATAQQYALPVDVPPEEIELIDGYVGEGYGRSRPDELRQLLDLARLEGVVLDPVYTGKAMFALGREWGHPRFSSAKHVLFLHTGGIYGLLAHEAALATALR
ncbi:MAG: D-cysteine desulfhydrase family protein [Myxococcales bacterium]|nr:D-cysteine desulfhydrase family protein [Myxococcales bacterium]